MAEQSVQHVADERGQRRLAGSASTVKAIQAVGQTEKSWIDRILKRGCDTFGHVKEENRKIVDLFSARVEVFKSVSG